MAAMKKATVTYTAPPGESKTLTIGSTILVSGKGDTVICEEQVMEKLQKAGGSIKVDGVTDYVPPRKQSQRTKRKINNGADPHRR